MVKKQILTILSLAILITLVGGALATVCCEISPGTFITRSACANGVAPVANSNCGIVDDYACVADADCGDSSYQCTNNVCTVIPQESTNFFLTEVYNFNGFSIQWWMIIAGGAVILILLMKK